MAQRRSHKRPSHGPRHSRTSTVSVPLPGDNRLELTRRQVLVGAAGIAVAGAAAAGGYAYSEYQKELSAIHTLSVPEQAVFVSTDCDEIEDYSAVMAASTSISLPYGSLVWSNDSSVAATLVPTDTGSPLVQAGLITFSNGNHQIVLEEAVNQSDGYQIFDVRANDKGIVWVEANILTGQWRVYGSTSPLAGSLSPYLLDEGSDDWEMPSLAAVGNYAWWQLLPQIGGAKKSENSLLRRAHFGTDGVETVYESKGRMSSPPYADSDSLVITPRLDASGTYYQLTRLKASSAEVTDTLVLPASMSPQEAGFGPTGFNFAFDAIYNYGDGIANLGTYTPITLPVVNEEDGSPTQAYSQTPWFRFARTPLAPPAWCGNWFMVKSTQAVCGVNFADMTYFALPVESGCDSYGEYLASTGNQDHIVTYTNIDYTSVSGENEKRCLVRVWTPVVV